MSYQVGASKEKLSNLHTISQFAPPLPQTFLSTEQLLGWDVMLTKTQTQNVCHQIKNIKFSLHLRYYAEARNK